MCYRGETDLLVKSADTPLSLADTWAPRFMNSDISYFGVGGKQAVFFIGNATRVSVLVMYGLCILVEMSRLLVANIVILIEKLLE